MRNYLCGCRLGVFLLANIDIAHALLVFWFFTYKILGKEGEKRFKFSVFQLQLGNKVSGFFVMN